MSKTIVNVTPHAINIRQEDGSDRIIPPSGTIARVSTKDVPAEAVDGIPTVKMVFGEIVGLPAPQEGTIFLASSLVAQAAQRADVLSPNTGPTAIRDESKQIVAVRSLQRFA